LKNKIWMNWLPIIDFSPTKGYYGNIRNNDWIANKFCFGDKMGQNQENNGLYSKNNNVGQTFIREEAEFWFRFSLVIPWEQIEAKFSPLFAQTRAGTAEEQARMLFGALIIREKYRLNNQETVKFIAAEPYLQYFIGITDTNGELPIDEGILDDFCAKLDLRSYGLINELLAKAGSAATPSGIEAAPDSTRREMTERTGKTKEFSAGNVADSEPAEHPEKTIEFSAVKVIGTGKTPKSSPFPAGQKSQRSNGSFWREFIAPMAAWVRNYAQFVRAISEKVQQKLVDDADLQGSGVRAALTGMFRNLIYWMSFIFTNTWVRIATLALVILSVGFLLFLILLPIPPPRMLMASEVYDLNHHLAATFYSENRRPVKLDEIPEFLRHAVIAVEDHRFYRHSGINPGRIIKAALYDLFHGNLEQGGSTITQQLVKNVYLNQERTFSRKFRELIIASKLELQLTKDQILELYLNKIYFGHGAYGVKVAAQTYFQKELNQLSPVEMAMLAGLPRGPAFYSPYKHPEKARERLLHTLTRMRECGYISQTQLEKYSRQTAELPGLNSKNNFAPYFMDLLQTEINKIFPGNPELLYTKGLIIESTLDLNAQKAAQNSFIKGLPKMVQRKGGIPQPQGALIAIDPKNGEIRALVGGSDYAKSQFNRATQARRQPGSAFKPMVYAAAFGNGYTLASKFDRSPQTYYVYGKPYRPTDHDNEYAAGSLSLRNALATSSNVVAVKLLQAIGYKPVINLARQLGIKAKLYQYPSMALGTCDLTPLELAGAYLPFANGGTFYQPTTIRRILDRQGRVLYRNSPEGTQALDPNIAFLLTQALTDVLKTGTAANAGQQFHRPAAGKTGTTNSNRDTWFVGYTPDLLTCVFIGCDHYERSLPGVAGYVAAPIWANFMTEALKKTPVRDFPVPSGIKAVTICKSSGMLARESCPAQTEYFWSGTEPVERCNRFHFNLHFFDKHPVEPDEEYEEPPEEPETIVEKPNPEKGTIDQKIQKIQKIFQRFWRRRN
jgi:1A family penicillin-binding protein